MKRRIKDYNTFLKESESVLKHAAVKDLSYILDPTMERKKYKAKGKDEIEQELGIEEGGNSISTLFEWNEDLKGYVGVQMIIPGKIVLKTVSEESGGSTNRYYEVLEGPNKGLKGDFEWSSSSNKSPILSLPYSKKEWSEILGPDKNTWETFYFHYNNNTKTDLLKGILGSLDYELVGVGEKGVSELHYEDPFQMYGKVRIYYNGKNVGENSIKNSPFSYEVMDGPNKGLEGFGFSLFKDLPYSEGILNPFSQGQILEFSYTDLFPSQIPMGGDTSKIDVFSRGSKKGVNPDLKIFLNTSSLEKINPPKSLEKLLKKAEKKGESIESENSNKIIKKITKTDLNNSNFYIKIELPSNENPLSPLNVKKIFSSGVKGNSSGEYYLSSYFGNPILIYSARCKKRNSPSLEWGSESGCYGNLLFAGYCKTKSGSWISIRGECYIDYDTNSIGIIYAYDEKGNKIEEFYDIFRTSEIQKKIIDQSREQYVQNVRSKIDMENFPKPQIPPKELLNNKKFNFFEK